jgi:hypothetical protein
MQSVISAMKKNLLSSLILPSNNSVRHSKPALVQVKQGPGHAGSENESVVPKDAWAQGELCSAGQQVVGSIDHCCPNQKEGGVQTIRPPTIEDANSRKGRGRDSDLIEVQGKGGGHCKLVFG